MKVKLLGLLIAALLLTIVFSGCFEETKKTTTVEPKTIYVDDSGGKDYTSIQDAIDNATDGDTVYVYSGTYYENIDINASIQLNGENVADTIIYGQGHPYSELYGGVVNVFADNVSIKNFIIKSGEPNKYAWSMDDGIVINSDNNKIQNNYITETENAIILKRANYNLIKDNFIGNNWVCFIFEFASNNTIINNTVSENVENRYHASFNYNNKISDNIFTNSSLYILGSYNYIYNNYLTGSGINIEMGDYNKIYNNILENSQQYSISIEGSMNYSILSIDGSWHVINNTPQKNIIDNNTINNASSAAIMLEFAGNNTISNNVINNAGTGIYMDLVRGNNIFNNMLRNNQYGIGIVNHIEDWFTKTENNYIFHNNFFNNEKNGYDPDRFNTTWYNVTLLQGNYWDDYTGIDSDNDGIGDTPYLIENNFGIENQDLYPLMKPFDI